LGPVEVIYQNTKIQILGGVGDKQKRWNIEVKGNSNRITLPILPKGLVPLLVAGDSYGLSLSGEHQYNASAEMGIVTEKYTSQTTIKR